MDSSPVRCAVTYAKLNVTAHVKEVCMTGTGVG